MEVILKEDVKNLGKAGDVVRVSEGYARNFLFPSNKAIPATEKNIARIKEESIKKKQANEILKNKAEELAKRINGLEIVVAERVSQDGTLYGSVSQQEILKELNKMGYELDKTSIILKEHIKKIGIYEIEIKLHNDVRVRIKVKVVASDGKK
ncbi:MAG: 50S ribosomal protein L9 [Candidatus Goldbacteria bacterium]|nr:50S ribosomal protein L9 [Candidatus Goldiibacteriota bacterium]